MCICLESDISLRLQKLNDVVAASLNGLHVLNGLSADSKLIIVCKQPVQPLQAPQENTLHLGHELFHEERIVGTVSRSVLGGQHDLTAKETVRLVMQGRPNTAEDLRRGTSSDAHAVRSETLKAESKESLRTIIPSRRFTHAE